MTADLGNLVAGLGLGNALAVMIFIAFFFLLKWVLGVSSEQLRNMHEERKAWAEIQMGFNCQMTGIQEQMKANLILSQTFFNQVQEAHKFQRDEHKELSDQNREITLCLGRINGYKEH